MKIFEIVSFEDAYSHNDTHEIYWRSMSAEKKALWEQRKVQLEGRSRKIYRRLTSIMPAEDLVAVKGVPVNVPLHGEMAWAAANYQTREIIVDLGCFWDLPDDCLGYVLGHEIGHFVYEKKNPGFWRKRIPDAVNRKLEMDADIYGAILAYRLGYDPKLAWNQFTRAEREAPFDPKYPNYPSVSQRKAAVSTAIKKHKDDQAAAKASAQQANVPADKQGQVPQANPDVQPTQEPAVEPQTTNSKPEVVQDPPLTSAAKVDLSHAKHGIEGLLANLNADPQIALHMFPTNRDSNTALA